MARIILMCLTPAFGIEDALEASAAGFKAKSTSLTPLPPLRSGPRREIFRNAFQGPIFMVLFGRDGIPVQRYGRNISV